MKSALEIALARADELTNNSEEKINTVELREKLKPLLAKFFKSQIDKDQFWQEMKDAETVELVEAQLMLINSVGLRNQPEQINRRKEAVLALESLKEQQKTAYLEQSFDQLVGLQQQYSEQREQINDKIKSQMEKQRQQGQGLDNQAKTQLSQQVQRFQKMFNDKFNKLLESLKEAVQ